MQVSEVRRAGRLTFKAWILASKDRTDPVGDLARDAAVVKDEWRDAETLRLRMDRYRASDHAIDAFHSAYVEWTRYADRMDERENTVGRGRLQEERHPDESGRRVQTDQADREMIRVSTFTQWVKTQEGRQDAIGYFARYWASVTPGKISSIDGVFKRLSAIEKETANSHDEKARTAIGAALSGYHLAVKDYQQVRAREQAESHGLVVHVPDEVPPVTASQPQDESHPDGDYDSSPGLRGEPISPEALARADARRESRDHLGTREVSPGVVAGPVAPDQRYQLDHDEVGPRIVRKVPRELHDRPLQPEPDDAPRSRLDQLQASQELLHDRLELIERKLSAIVDALYPEPLDWDALYSQARHAYEDEAFPKDQR